MLNQLVISAAVEGSVDEAVIRRLIGYVGLTPGPIYGKKGKDDLRKKIRAYNLAAQHAPWVILVDLDNDADCAPALRQAWLSNPAPNLCFRVAVRQVEAWLMADRETLAKFLGIPQDKIPRAHPKNGKTWSPGREVTADGLNGCTMALDRTAYPCPSASC
jgi:hypothetical protein